MVANILLRRRMAERRMTKAELACEVNNEIEMLTGKAGTVSERTIHNWLTGATRWPPAKIRHALKAVFGCSLEELGFVPTSRTRTTPEEDVRRRDFMTAVGGSVLAAAATTAASTTSRRIGTADIERLQFRFAEVIASDHRLGGRLSIESQAAALADAALALQEHGIATQRIRSALYACAASFTSSAMWAAIDGRRFDAALRHHQKAAYLAAMSGDFSIQFRIWSHAGSLYRHLGRPGDALAANDVARNLPITRRDPLFASLGHARHAAIHGLTGDVNAVRRSLGRVQEALDRADPSAPRPLWIAAFYDQAELDSLALAAHLSAGNWEDAEAHAHRSLAGLRDTMQRSRAITTVRLAQAQLGQGDFEHAVSTAMAVPTEVSNHPRITGMLTVFGAKLDDLAVGSSPARDWAEYAHTIWRTT
ncbi:helix-turn-helix transcriptional regulator [Streptomyces kaniharaensis]|uniref:Helix-turn-helix transcriptional regulator n=1 Tax=Streptomyces kaniharaensis TaxID=212423 RepID=A0A6N7KMZ9_9ACTN|nr:helix-turn-helix transcriptional regulator [Streptomyces kaniharaensis]MQS11828.1 helix-turn-helix transcriptional regulator [Streptomyces kaniharaensis]